MTRAARDDEASVDVDVPRAAIWLALACIACGCGAAEASREDEVICASGWGIIHGDLAPQATLAAVGTLGRLDETGRYRPVCTATLISSDHVLTAKHCTLVAQTQLYFALGHDAINPERPIAVAAHQTAGPLAGGVAGLGSDVALCQLTETISDLAPIKIAPYAAVDQLGTRVQVVGFGIAETACGAQSDWQRRSGEQVLGAVRGNVFDLIYGDHASFLAAAMSHLSPSAAEQRYRRGELLEGYEAWAEPGPAGSLACKGDSGGPVLATVDGAPAVIGVSSWVWQSFGNACDHGAVIALLAPDIHEMIATALGS